MGERDQEPSADVGTPERQEQDIRRPPKYRVVILNDEHTSAGFVMLLVRLFFGKSTEEALRLSREVQDEGAATAGVYTHEIAETKVVQAQLHARAAEEALLITMEPDD